MATIAVLVKFDEVSAAETLRNAAEKLTQGEGEVAIDFSSVRRIDSATLVAIEAICAQS